MYCCKFRLSFEIQGQLPVFFFTFTAGGRPAGFQHVVIQIGCLTPFRLPIVPQSLFSFRICSSLLSEDEDQLKWWVCQLQEGKKLVSGTHAIYIQGISGPTSCSVCVIFRRATICGRSGGWNCVNSAGEGDQNAWKSSGLIVTESGSQMMMAYRLGEFKESSECAACMASKGCLAGCFLAVFKSHLCLHCWQDHLLFIEQ